MKSRYMYTFTSVRKTTNEACTNPWPSGTGCFCTALKFTVMLLQTTPIKKSTNQMSTLFLQLQGKLQTTALQN